MLGQRVFFRVLESSNKEKFPEGALGVLKGALAPMDVFLSFHCQCLHGIGVWEGIGNI